VFSWCQNWREAMTTITQAAPQDLPMVRQVFREYVAVAE
jgi:hypothetical protein